MASSASCALTLLLAADAAAQTSAPASRPRIASLGDRILAEARAGLRSEDLAVVAWAACHTREFALEDLAEEVERALLRLGEGPEHPHRGLVAIALCDALVRLDTAVSARVLEVWWSYDSALDDALMTLAARRPAGHMELIRRVAASGDPTRAWFCACNLLIQLEPARLVQILAPRTAFDVELVAVEPGREPCRDTSGAITMRCSSRYVPDAFPPIARIRLERISRTLAPERLLANGPVAIGWRREAPSRLVSWSTQEPGLDASSYALACLVHMAQVGEKVHGLAPKVALTVPWQDAERWQADCSGRLRDLRRQWSTVVTGLTARGLLPADAQPRDPLRVRVRDERADKTTPLPRVE